MKKRQLHWVTLLQSAAFLPFYALAAEPDIEQDLVQAQDRLMDRFERFIEFLPMLGIALAIVLVFYLLARWVSRWTWPFNKLSKNGFLQDMLRQIAQLVIFLLGLLLALDLLDATAILGAVMGTAGVVGLAVGFAFKDVVENYLAGILLSLRQPFQPRDHIEVDGFNGKVMRLTSRATILMTNDGNHVRIPNAVVFKSPMQNFTRNPLRRFDFIVGVGSGEDLAGAQKIGVEVMQGMKSVMADPDPSASLEPPGDSSIGVHFYGWVDQNQHSFVKVRSEAIRLVTASLDHAGIDMPEPIYRVRWNDGSGLNVAVGEMESPEQEKAASRASSNVQPAAEKPPIQAEQDTSVESDIDAQIEKEQAAEDSTDLLNKEAPKE